MKKNRFIGLRLSEAEFSRLQALKNGKTVGQAIRELITAAVEQERENAKTFLSLMQKIDTADLSKISQKLEILAADIAALKPKPRTGPSAVERIESRLDTLAADIADVYAAIIQTMEWTPTIGEKSAMSFQARRRKIRDEEGKRCDTSN